MRTLLREVKYRVTLRIGYGVRLRYTPTEPILCASRLLLFTLVACTSMNGGSVKLNNGYRVSFGAVSLKTKIFLIAGSRDSANFAQEVIDQIKFWKKQGYSQEEIACYYVTPMGNAESDKEQFGDLFSDLRDCYFADPRNIYQNIKSVTAANPDEVYVYVSSHGSKPWAEQKLKYKTKEDKINFEKILSYPQWAHTYSLEVEGYYESESMFWAMDNITKAWNFALEHPGGADDYLFTPGGLRKALATLPVKTKKIAILQGCYSGGFILSTHKVGKENTLDGLENTFAMTASRSDRTSFGCDAGSHTTYFGDAYLSALKKHAEGKKLQQIDWKKVFKTTESIVAEKEASLGHGKRDDSRPQYYSR